MRKISRAIVIIFIPFILLNFISCKRFNIKSTDELITAPNNNANYLSGVWKVKSVKIVDSNLANNKSESDLMNVSISFSDSMAVVGSNTLMNPKTKLKVYYSEHYLLYQYNINLEQLNLAANTPVKVISVYENNNMFCEAILTDSKDGYIYQNGVIYQVYKISEMVDKLPEISKKDPVYGPKVESKAYSYDSPTGVLLGLKSARVKNKDGSYNEDRYRTLWISFDGKLNPIYERNDIFMPRLKGFSVMNVKNSFNASNSSNQEYVDIFGITLNGIVENNKVKGGLPKGAEVNRESTRVAPIQKLIDILFVSNDYFSAQYYDGNLFNNSYPTLKTLPVDNPNNEVGLYLGTLGKEATKSYSSAVEVLKNKSGKVYKPNTQDFGVIRQNGYWSLKGRAVYDDDYSEFNLNILPGKKLITYDKLFVSWPAIKDRVPNALDAVTSPTARIAVVTTKTKLLIYNIINGELDKEPLKQIDLKDDEEIIMAEWANNEFVNSWTKAFKSYGNYSEIK
ncbi:hypothetical protein [Inconstantimicrobium mannanitabidum]|uniref:Lipoprotein n=1 Tax=Inconstantimicrobium mannanitabidum TaxID=1604901 RepID=A0ACB5R779_9CLOT|nr:hypothetical protein [Clostridium sp. TW13]GKX64896.1 lipoprotein [Clostridium sp. TW13]